jgi:hypothetical protein
LATEAVDKAIDGGSAEPIMKFIWEAVRVGVERRFAEATTAQGGKDDVQAMRRQVQAYISLLRYVERISVSASSPEDNSHASPPASHDANH